MRIAIFNWRDIENPKAGGAEIVTHEYAKGWVKADHSVTVVCPAFPNSTEKEILDGVKYYRLGKKTSGNYLFIHLLTFFYYQRHLKGKIDLVVDQIHWVPFFIPLYVKEKKLAFIHEVAQKIWAKQFGELVGGMGKKIEPLLFQIYKNIPFLTVSKSTKSDLSKMGIPEKNITVIRNGINILPLNKLSKKEKEPTLIYVGRLTKAKNVEDVVSAFKIVSKKIPAVQFWIVGGNDDPIYLDELKRRTNDRVKFWGFVTDNEKEKLMAKSHLLLHASLTEGWGLVVIEAAAMGTPAVVYNVPGLSESVVNGKTGVVCDQNTPEEIAKQVLALLSDAKKYRAMQKNCLAQAKEFSWGKSITKSLKLIENI